MIIVVVIVVFAVIVWFFLASGKNQPYRVGVLLSLTGPDAINSDDVLSWAADRINKNGGINGHKIELVFKDIYKAEQNGQDIKNLAQEFIKDKSIKAVIGPETSLEVYDIAPLFIENKKLLISPTATAGDLYRAFGNKEFFWRTCQGDVAQIRMIIHELAQRKVKKIALLYDDGPYGKTFLDWAGFFAIEEGVELLNTVSFKSNQQMDLAEAVHYTLADDPEYVIGVAFAEDAVEIKRELDKQSPKTKLFLTDAAESNYIIDELGQKAEGIELVSPAADPTTGFTEEYEKNFGYTPWDFSASTYDAFLLTAYTLARQEYTQQGLTFWKRENSGEALARVVGGRGEKISWQDPSRAIAEILAGNLPDITGASGPLEFDKSMGVDPVETYYSFNRIESRGGLRDFWTIDTVSSDKSSEVGYLEEEASAYNTKAAVSNREDITAGDIKYFPKERKGLKAVIIATSNGWDNYRHQADALTMYQMLKKNGLSDDDIIFFSADDIPYNKGNPLPGVVRHVPRGQNIRKDAVIDYAGNQVTIKNFINVMLGQKTEETPTVLEADENTDVFLYIVDHGARGYIPFINDEKFMEESFLNVVNKMYEENKYRQLFVMVEVCFGESMALNLKTPGVVYLTGAAKNEQSFAIGYDTQQKSWLADDFSNAVVKIISSNPDIFIDELYMQVYGKVIGSHVRLKNFENFGDITSTKISQFLSP